MSLKNTTLPQAAEQPEAISQDDAWLNDVGPGSPRPSPAQPPAPADERQEGEDVPAVRLTPGHPLWPVVLSLSERIWQELQKPDLATVPEATLAKYVRRRGIEILRADVTLARRVGGITQAEALLQSVSGEVLGYGPLESLLRDESVTKIMAVGPRFVYVERGEKVEDAVCYFEDERHMLRIIENMLRRAGRRLPTNWPIIDVRLPDSSCVNIVLPPSAVNGPTITILRGPKEPLNIGDLLASATLTHEMADFLGACVRGHLNIAVCGGVGSGRTTLLNALSTYIAADERIVTLEEAAQLRLSQKHVIALVAQQAAPGAAGGAGVTLRDLVVNALRTGSERILLDECRGSEVVELVQAMNNGHGGVLLSIFAHDARNCLSRLENMYRAADPALSLPLVRTQLADALDVIVFIARLPDGSRRILNIAEVQRVENAAMKLQSIFHFRHEGAFEASGFVPSFLSRLKAMGLHLSPELFKPKDVLGQPATGSTRSSTWPF